MRKHLWGLGCVLGLMSGCATATGTAPEPGSSERSPPTDNPWASSRKAKPQAPAAALPTCPEDLVADEGLELAYRPEMKARAWVKALTTTDLGFQPREQVTPAFQQRLTLGVGPLEVLGLRETRADSTEGGGSVVLARPHAGGYCVVNSWSTWQSSVVDLSLAGTWLSPDGRLAILLLKLALPNQQGGPETRWVTLGTNGHRAWIALGTPPQHQLIVPSVKLFPQGKDLYVDIQQRRVTRLRLGEDGYFVLPAPAK